jgi:hypothetical protein
MTEVPFVLGEFWKLEPEAIEQIKTHVHPLVRRNGVDRREDEGRQSRARLRPRPPGYCYIVAGIVGEMLTELFLLGRPEIARGRAVPAQAGGDRSARRCSSSTS